MTIVGRGGVLCCLGSMYTLRCIILLVFIYIILHSIILCVFLFFVAQPSALVPIAVVRHPSNLPERPEESMKNLQWWLFFCSFEIGHHHHLSADIRVLISSGPQLLSRDGGGGGFAAATPLLIILFSLWRHGDTNRRPRPYIII